MRVKGLENEFDFAQEIESKTDESQNNWKVLIVDDDNEIHAVTRMVLDGIEFLGKKSKLISAYSGEEAKEIIKNNPDTALIILDVVMEEEDSGLKVVKYIREELKNTSTRIILRTGYPGQAPEKRIIIDFDINDYKEKTELSSRKLLTSVISALRSYNDISIISDLNFSLEKKVIERTAELEKVNEKLTNTLEMLKADLMAGRKIQFKLLPEAELYYGDYEFSRVLIPSLYLSGDFVNYFLIDRDHIGFYFADVSGHGAASAFVTVLIKNFVEGYLTKFCNSGDSTILNPHEVLARLNAELIFEGLEKYLTIFYGVIVISENKLKYTNGGQFPYPVIFSARGVETIEANGPPVGLFKFSKYKSNELDLPEEFIISLISDGIMEIIEAESLQAKQDVIKNLFNDFDLEINDLIKKLKIENDIELPDDITFLMIKKRKQNE